MGLSSCHVLKQASIRGRLSNNEDDAKSTGAPDIEQSALGAPSLDGHLQAVGLDVLTCIMSLSGEEAEWVEVEENFEVQGANLRKLVV
jgi:hypothetical protein